MSSIYDEIDREARHDWADEREPEDLPGRDEYPEEPYEGGDS